MQLDDVLESLLPTAVAARPKWFVQIEGCPQWGMGFASKRSASEWIDAHGARLDWRAGFCFRLRGINVDIEIVDRLGAPARV